MGLWQTFTGALSRLFYSTPGAKSDAYGLVDTISPTGMPPRRGTLELLRAVTRLPWLHTAVMKMARDTAAGEYRLYKKAGPVPMRSLRRRAARGVPYEGELRGAVEVLDHPFLDLLENPNPLFTCLVFWALVQAYLDTKGEVFLVVERAQDGLPLELWPIPPHWCRMTPTPSDPFFHFSYSGWVRDVPERDVVWLRHPTLEQPYGRGSGTGDALGDELDIDEFAAKHMKSFFFNRALPDAFVIIKGIAGTGARVQDEIDRFEKKLEDKHRGIGKAWRPHFAGGDIDVKTVGTSLKDQQMKELRNLQRDTLLQVWGIPPECVGIVENSNRATINSALYIYALNVLGPRLAYLASAVTPIAREWDPTFFVTYVSPVEDDYEFQLRAMQAQPSLFRKNEWRKLAGMAPLDEFGEDLIETPAAAPVAADPTAGPDPANEEPAAEDPAQDPSDEEDNAKATKPVRRRLALAPVRSLPE